MTLPSFSAATALQAEPSAPRVRLSEHVGQPGSARANPFLASGYGVGDGFTGPGRCSFAISRSPPDIWVVFATADAMRSAS